METKVPDFSWNFEFLFKLFVNQQGLSVLVGRKVTALYENGWFTRIIVYFNRELKEYKVDYVDKTSDYLPYNDFDGVEVILEPNCRQ